MAITGVLPQDIFDFKKLVPYVTAVASERRHHLANVIAIAKAFANWTETLPSSKSRDTKTRRYQKSAPYKS